MITELALSHVSAVPGQSASVEIAVTNTSDVIEGVTAIVDGINPDWIRLERPLVSLFPDATNRVVVIFDIPVDCRAGDYLIDVRIVSAIDSSRESVQDFWLTVLERPGLGLDLVPSVVTGGSRGRTRATVTNTGNTPLDVALSADDPTRAVDCDVEVPRVLIPYGESAPIDIVVRGKRPWFGQPVPRTIQVRATADRNDPVERVLTFNQKPRVPRGLLTILMLSGIVALWAFIFLWVIGELRSAPPPPKAAASAFETGEGNIPLAAIAGTVTGTARASTTGEGIPRVTVEAIRIADAALVPGEPPPDPATFEVPIASGATGDDGTYSLATLVPGRYVLRFSEPGYGSQEVTGVIIPVPEFGAKKVPVTEDVTLTGAAGTVTAQIALPDGVVATQLTATIVPTNSGGSSTASALRSVAPGQQAESACSVTQAPVTIGADARNLAQVTCADLPTPGTFTITVSGPGLDTKRIDVELTGGDSPTVDTVRIGGEPATLSGRVVDQDGAGLVGVAVTVSSGNYVARVFSTGDGSYRIDDLPAPGSYVADFRLDGYSRDTRAIDLEVSGTPTLNAQLIGGTATITGFVNGPTGPLGGATVIVLGDGVRVDTTSSTGGAVGQFDVDGLVVPGSYSISVSLAGYRTETRSVVFDGPAVAPPLTFDLVPLDSSVTGRLLDPRREPIPDAEVVLTDGLVQRSTFSVSEGDFLFGEVAAGDYTVTITYQTDDGDVVVVRRVTVTAGDPVTDLGDIQVSTPTRIEISGRVVDAAGNGITGATVELLSVDPTRRFITPTVVEAGRELGEYYFGQVDIPGRFLLIVSHPSYGTASIRDIQIPASETGATYDLGDITLAGASISGTVFADSAPTGGLTVELYELVTENGAPIERLVTSTVSSTSGTVGSYRFDALLTGRYRVKVANATETGVVLDLDAGEDRTSADLAVTYASVSGTITANGLPTAGLTVELYRVTTVNATTTESLVTTTQTTDVPDLGRYSFVELLSGRYRVTVRGATEPGTIVDLSPGAARTAFDLTVTIPAGGATP